MRVIKERYRRPLQAGTGVRIRPVFDDFHRLRPRVSSTPAQQL
jgi:hypothetical protein